SKAKADGGKRHGDSAIALALACFASREINKGPVNASSRRRRQAARMLEGVGLRGVSGFHPMKVLLFLSLRNH
ncbi:hypothetical protein ACAF92_26995, partial [Escherichia coli]